MVTAVLRFTSDRADAGREIWKQDIAYLLPQLHGNLHSVRSPCKRTCIGGWATRLSSRRTRAWGNVTRQPVVPTYLLPGRIGSSSK